MFLVLLLLFSAVYGEVLNCDGYTEVSLKHGPVSVPASGALGQLPYGTSQNCTWKFSIPVCQYVTLKVFNSFTEQGKSSMSNAAHIPTSSVFMIYNTARTYNHKYSIAGISDLPAALNTTFYLPPDKKGLFVQLVTQGSTAGYFSFTAQLHEIPTLPAINQTVSTQIMIDLAMLTQKMFIFHNFVEKTFLFRVAAPAPDFRYDSCFVFNGADPKKNDFLLGLASQVEFIPSRLLGPCAVLCLGTDFPKAQLVATPPPDSMDKDSSWTIRTGDNIIAQLNSLQDISGKYPYPSYLTTYCPGGCVEYLQSVTSSIVGSQLTLYSGTPNDRLTKLESFPIDSQDLYCPQRMPGTWKTYLVYNSPITYLTINRERTAGWEVAREGRKIIFETTGYGQRNYLQNTTAVFAPSSRRMLTFQCTVLDFNSTTDYLLMTVDQGSGNTKTTKFTTSGPKAEVLKGYSLKLDYIQGSQTSVGGLFKFEMTASAGSLSIFFVLASVVNFVV